MPKETRLVMFFGSTISRLHFSVSFSVLVSVEKIHQLPQTVNVTFHALFEARVTKEPPGGDSHAEQTGMLFGNFEFNP